MCAQKCVIQYLNTAFLHNFLFIFLLKMDFSVGIAE
jgi:hypothetical protein